MCHMPVVPLVLPSASALTKGTSHVVHSGAPVGNLLATVGSYKSSKDLDVALETAHQAQREKRVLIIPALRRCVHIYTVLTTTR